MKKLIIILSCVLSIYANDSLNTWEYKDWKVEKRGDLWLKSFTNGKIVYGNKFGILKSRKNCKSNLLWLTISTYEKNLDSLKNKQFKFELNIDSQIIFLKLKVVNIYKFNDLISIVTFSDSKIEENLLELLKKSNVVKLKIIEPKNLINKFDIPHEEFSLKGFVANYAKIEASCNDINELLIPPSEIPLDKKEKKIKVYDIKNIIGKDEKCDNKNLLNTSIKEQIGRISVFTISGNYFYYGYGHDGQESFEDINVINLCNANNPKKVTKISGTGAQIFGMYVDGKYLYVNSSTYDNNKLQIIDISNYKVVSTIDNIPSAINPFFVYENKLYFESENRKLTIYDISDKKYLSKEIEITIPFNKYSIASIAVDENYIYITGNKNLRIYDKKTYKLISNTKFDKRTSSIIVKDKKAIIHFWDNYGSSDYLTLLNLEHIKNPLVLEMIKVNSGEFRKINYNTISYHYDGVRIFNFDDIEKLYNNLIELDSNQISKKIRKELEKSAKSVNKYLPNKINSYLESAFHEVKDMKYISHYYTYITAGKSLEDANKNIKKFQNKIIVTTCTDKYRRNLMKEHNISFVFDFMDEFGRLNEFVLDESECEKLGFEI